MVVFVFVDLGSWGWFVVFLFGGSVLGLLFCGFSVCGLFLVVGVVCGLYVCHDLFGLGLAVFFAWFLRLFVCGFYFFFRRLVLWFRGRLFVILGFVVFVVC